MVKISMSTMIKEAWLPPKRLRGDLSAGAWKKLVDADMFGGDQKIIGGIEKRLENLRAKYPVNIKEYRYKDLFVPQNMDILDNGSASYFVKQGPFAQVYDGVAMGKSIIGRRSNIHLYDPKSKYGKVVLFAGTGKWPRDIDYKVTKSHELNETARRWFHKNDNVEMQTVIKTPSWKKKILPGSLSKDSYNSHFDPSVLLDESNEVLRLKSKPENLIATRFKNGEAMRIKHLTGKTYGKQWFTPEDAQKMREKIKAGK